MPLIYIPGGHWGVNSPITAAGALALGNAGQLGALVLSQLKQEGTPFIVGDSSGSILDMKTMNSCYVSPDSGPFDWDMARYHGLPTFGIAGVVVIQKYLTLRLLPRLHSLFLPGPSAGLI